MKAKIEQYLDNLDTFTKLNHQLPPADSTDQDILKFIREKTVQIKGIFLDNNRILDEILFKYKRHPELIDDEVYQSLSSFVSTLSKKNFNIDVGICCEIYELLFEYAKKTNNLDEIIAMSYQYGLSVYYIDQVIYAEKYFHIFKTAIDQKDHYFELSKKSRELFNRCYSNLLLALNDNRYGDVDLRFKIGAEAMAWWEREDVKKKDPEFPFETYIYTLKRNLMTVVSFLRTPKRNVYVSPERVEICCQYASDVYQQGVEQVKMTLLPLFCGHSVAYYTTMFHAGKISIEVLLDQLKDLTRLIDNDEYKLENYTRVFRMNGLYLEYLNNYSTYPLEEKRKILRTIHPKVMAYAKEMAFKEQSRLTSRFVMDYLQGSCGLLDEKEIIDLVIECTIHRYAPTYVHAYLVANISDILLNALLKIHPEYLIGVNDFDLDYINKHSDELKELMRNCAHLHDIGKYQYFSIIGNHYRSLTEKERTAVQRHAFIGSTILGEDKLQPLYNDAILLHHLWYNEKNGYPKNHHRTKNCPLIDILTIADAIESATDYLGRPYAGSKTLGDLIEEMKTQSGIRYSPVILDLLNQTDVVEKIYEQITDERENRCIHLYRDAISSPKN